MSPMTLLCRGNLEEFQRLFAPLAPLCACGRLKCPVGVLDEVVKAFGLTAATIMLQGVFSSLTEFRTSTLPFVTRIPDLRRLFYSYNGPLPPAPDVFPPT
ncbi:hypothetical protein EVAR_98482_1 [Eumeta japonica]|uniref:Uncharacterized protein n=1 Tax=Eumeta variegata TaxID=151549 RepID=A0A4C1YJV6_EUMVA|nr:hypothetical protein EVAR_98482_1 [Eumeta japonica]